MTFKVWTRFVAMTVLMLAPACAGEDASDATDSAEIQANGDTPPGLPPGTTLVDLPSFGEEPRVEQIPNEVGHLQAWTLGKGSPVIVIVNGGPGLSSAYVTGLHHGIAEKVPNARVIRYDQRGMGASTKTTSAQNTVLGYVEDIEAIRKHFGVEKLHLVGQSFGGWVAGAYASMHPERVSSFVSVDGVPPEPSTSEANTKADEVWAERQKALVAKGDILEATEEDSEDVKSNKSIGLYFADPHRIPFESTAPTTQSSESMYVEYDRDWRDHGDPLVANVSKLRMPTLVIGADKSVFAPYFHEGTMNALRAAKPKLVVLRNAGHQPWFEQPAVLFSAIEDFYAPLID